MTSIDTVVVANGVFFSASARYNFDTFRDKVKIVTAV